MAARRKKSPAPSKSPAPVPSKSPRSVSKSKSSSGAETPTAAEIKKTQLKAEAKSKRYAPVGLEFGGPWGAGFIIVISHVLLYYVWYIVNLNNGELVPRTTNWWQQLAAATTPSAEAAGLYFSILAVQTLFAYILPGLVLNGRADEAWPPPTYL